MAPYEEGYELSLNNKKYSNPYLNQEGLEADASDFARGYENATEEKNGRKEIWSNWNYGRIWW